MVLTFMKSLIKFIILITFFPLVLMTYNNCGDEGAFRANRSINFPPPIRNNLGISINNDDEYTTDLHVNLTLTAPNPKANEMFISFDPHCSQGSWEALKTNKSIELNSPNQTNTVYVKYRSPGEGEIPCISDSIIHDDISPTVGFVNSPASWIKETSLRIGVGVEDSGSGVQSIECDKQGSGHFEVCGSGEMVYDSLVENQNYVLVVKAQDRAGNPSEPRRVHWALDRTPPTLTLSTGPSSPTADTTPDFNFIPVDRGSGIARLECRLDSQVQFSPCQFHFSLSGLSDGSHTIEVRAVDNVGWVSQPVSHSWTQDATVPTIHFTEKPPAITREQGAVFGFSGINNNQGIVSYGCQLDGGAKQACGSPHTLRGLSEGQHSFLVVGLDSANNESQPMTYVWWIDRSQPTLSLLEKPESFTKSTQARFVFQARSQGSGIKEIQCKIDNGAYGVCSSPKLLNNLSEGNHSFSIKAVNQAGGNSDVISHQWTVDQTNPTVRITSRPENLTGSKNASFSFQAGDTGSGIQRTECRLDGGVFETCQSPKSYANLSEGDHTFSVRARDQADNPSSVETYNWFIYASPPTVTLNISTNQPQAPVMGWKIVGGNGSLPYAAFDEVRGMVPEHRPENWFKSENPFLTHIRIGNFIFGHCNTAAWVDKLGLTLEELVSSFDPNNQKNPLEFNFGKMDLYIRNMLASGTRPHIVLSGIPKAIAGSSWQCSNFGRIGTPPPSENMDYLEKTYDGLISHLKTEFGDSEVRSWRWSTWSEFNCPCSFKGSVDEAIEIVRRGVRVAKKHGLNLRIGDFISPRITTKPEPENKEYERERLLHDFILAMKNDSKLDILRDTPGIGISIYDDDPYEAAKRLRNMHHILTEYGYPSLPIHIDQLGFTYLTVNGQKKKSYTYEPGIYSTSWFASFFHEVIYSNIGQKIKIGDIHLWHRKNKFPASRPLLVRSSKFYFYDWLYQLRNHRKLSAQVQGETTTSTDSIRSFNTENQDRTVFTSIILRHSKDFRAEGQKTARLCFENLPSGAFELTHLVLDKNNGNGWEVLLHLWDKNDTFDYYNKSTRKYEFPVGFFNFNEARLAQLQLAAEPTRYRAYKFTLLNHRYCIIITLEPHAVHKVQLTKID